MFKKAMRAMLGIVLLAGALLCFKPVRVWASEEGAWIYHWLWVNGPGTFYTSNTWKDSGGTTHTGLEVNSGTYSSRTTLSLRFLGAMATSARPACATALEGDTMWDTTIHSIAFCDGANWHKSVYTSSANDTWTEY